MRKTRILEIKNKRATRTLLKIIFIKKLRIPVISINNYSSMIQELLDDKYFSIKSENISINKNDVCVRSNSKTVVPYKFKNLEKLNQFLIKNGFNSTISYYFNEELLEN